MLTKVQQERGAASSWFHALLMANSQHGNFTSQSSYEGRTKCLSMSSNVRLARSVCPSDCGWRVEDKHCFTPRSLNTSLKNLRGELSTSVTDNLSRQTMLGKDVSDKDLIELLSTQCVPTRSHLAQPVHKHHNRRMACSSFR